METAGWSVDFPNLRFAGGSVFGQPNDSLRHPLKELVVRVPSFFDMNCRPLGLRVAFPRRNLLPEASVILRRELVVAVFREMRNEIDSADIFFDFNDNGGLFHIF